MSKMIDSDCRIISLSENEFPDWVNQNATYRGSTPDKISFFYSPSADAVVVNENHENADIYSLLIPLYLSGNEALHSTLKNLLTASFLDGALDGIVMILDNIIKRRRKLHNETN